MKGCCRGWGAKGRSILVPGSTCWGLRPGEPWERICELETRGYSASTFAVCLLRAGDPMAVTTPWGHF